MIIFDTNALNLLNPESPRADFIRKLRRSGHHRVAVPWMVLEEMAAHQAVFYPDKYESVLKALEKLRAVLPWEMESTLEPLNVERLLDHWRGIYGEIFEVIETSGDVARKALAREAMHLPPAKRAKDHSEGARDVAIWFSVLEFLKANPDEHVHLVTNNSTDFGDGTTYPYPMNEDVRGLEKRLTLLKDFDQVVSQFSNNVSGKGAEAAAAELLRSQPVRGRVAQTAMDFSSPAGFLGLGSSDETVEWSEWLIQPEVELLSIAEVTGHEIEGNVWYTANATWLLYGLVGDRTGTVAGYIACVWEMKVLFSADDGDETPTVLWQNEPSAPDASDTTIMEALKRLKERVADLSRRAVRPMQGESRPDRLLQQQLSETLAKLDAAGEPTRRLAEQFAASQSALESISKLVAASQVDHLAPIRKFLDQQAALRADILSSTMHKVAQQFAANQPKLDIAAWMPPPSFADLMAASLAAGAGDATVIDEDEQEEGEQLSFSDIDDDEAGASPKVSDDAPEN